LGIEDIWVRTLDVRRSTMAGPSSSVSFRRLWSPPFPLSNGVARGLTLHAPPPDRPIQTG
jgi:hypothetical protein